MSKVWPFIVVLLIGVVATFFLMGGCNHGKDVQSLHDQLKAATAKDDTIQLIALDWKAKHDSITSAKRKGDSLYTHKIDSLNSVCNSLKSKFLSTRDTIANLHDRLNKAFADNDTTGVWGIADSLNNQLVKANNALFAWQIGRDSVSTAQLSEIQRLQGIIITLQAQISQFQGLLKMCTDNNAALSKIAQMAIKKAKTKGLLNKIGIGIVGLLGIILIAK